MQPLMLKLDIANDDVSDIVEEQEASTYSNSVSGKTEQLSPSTLSNCATITRVPAFGTAITPGTLVTKTIDFGTVGCTFGERKCSKRKNYYFVYYFNLKLLHIRLIIHLMISITMPSNL